MLPTSLRQKPGISKLPGTQLVSPTHVRREIFFFKVTHTEIKMPLFGDFSPHPSCSALGNSVVGTEAEGHSVGHMAQQEKLQLGNWGQSNDTEKSQGLGWGQVGEDRGLRAILTFGEGARARGRAQTLSGVCQERFPGLVPSIMWWVYELQIPPDFGAASLRPLRGPPKSP